MICTVWFLLNTCFLSEVGNSGTWPTPNKYLSTESLIGFPGRQHFTRVVTALLQELSTSRLTPVGEDSWKLVPGFLQTLPYGPSPLDDLALSPFTVINYCNESDYRLSPVSPSRESPNLGRYQGSLTHIDNPVWSLQTPSLILKPGLTNTLHTAHLLLLVQNDQNLCSYHHLGHWWPISNSTPPPDPTRM